MTIFDRAEPVVNDTPEPQPLVQIAPEPVQAEPDDSLQARQERVVRTLQEVLMADHLLPHPEVKDRAEALGVAIDKLIQLRS